MKVTNPPAVWHVLAHPARRRLIELLRDGPTTTGQLARAFSVSRFAVMKHLAVLERAGLIAVRREGRERWNELIVASGFDWTGFLGLAKAPPEESPAASPVVPLAQNRAPQDLTPFAITQDVLIEAPAARVFDALTFNVAAWWGPPYLRSAHATNVILEAHLGGRLYEEWGHRQGFIRGLVTAVRQDERLEIAGTIVGRGPLPATLHFLLQPHAGATHLAVAHRGVAAGGGHARAAQAWAAAWRELFSVRLKAFVERGVRSGIGDQPSSDRAMSQPDDWSVLGF